MQEEAGKTGSTEQEWHRKFAVSLFNHVWTLLDEKDRSEEKDDEDLLFNDLKTVPGYGTD